MVKKPEGGRANHIYRRSNAIPTQFICAWSDEHSKAKKVKYRQQMCSRDRGNCNGFWPWWSFLASQNCHQTIGATSGTFDQPGTPQPVSVPSLQHFCHPYFIHIGFGVFIKACAKNCDVIVSYFLTDQSQQNSVIKHQVTLLTVSLGCKTGPTLHCTAGKNRWPVTLASIHVSLTI